MSVPTLDSQLCFALYSASSHLTSIYRPLLDPLGLTYTQFIVLMALWEEDNISISQLAKKASLSKATMTPLLKRLEQKQLIRRQVLTENERQKNIVLTDAGRDLSKKSAEITDKVFCSTGLTVEQAKEIMSLCRLMLKHGDIQKAS
ncbi:MarR family winged helix-turn-helix transcriptional regulator [Agarilytica rhodophyticola]|uniref:MarR family winged helix-turn-helix transcriptional regulator n=1 Tax=Agarilytica rhodophyticola TaxID=1737490 RepID=UPI000B3479C1|nr:MarR family transcriptional regulator [Agarilytica rhodophyticola]